MTYRHLDSDRILATLDVLRNRIRERFPDAGLVRVATELRELGAECATDARVVARPHWPLRVGTAVLIAIMVVASATVLVTPWTLGIPTQFADVSDYVQAVEAAVNDLVFLGIALWFLGSLEGRVKRRRALRGIHQLRSLAHVVDMHQLTKDPERLASTQPATASSPRQSLTPAQLGRYLDYCSELLSLTSKIAALYVQRFDDGVVLAAVNEVEALTTGLSGKIWQKITILEQSSDPPAA